MLPREEGVAVKRGTSSYLAIYTRINFNERISLMASCLESPSVNSADCTYRHLFLHSVLLSLEIGVKEGRTLFG